MIRDEEINQKARELALDWNVGCGNEFYYRFDKLVDIARWADRNQPNPWISVKEKMPPIKTRVLFLDNNGKAWLGKNTISGYAELESDQPEILPPPTVPTCKPIITHWMPIPELKTTGNYLYSNYECRR